MSIDATLDGSAVPVDAILLRSQANNGLTMASAADGVGSQGSVVFDDPGGSLDVQGFMPVTVDEPDCTTAPRLFTGYVYDRIYRRGEYKSGAARQIDTTLNDLNAVMSFRLIDGADGKRGVETDTARLAWILGSTYLSGLIADLGFVTPSGQNVDEADFRGQYPADVINSCVLGRLFFAYWDQGVEACGLFFDLPDATTYTCTFSVSNVIADTSSTCLYPLLDAELGVSPDEVYSKVRLSFLSGVVVRTNALTASTFFPSPVLSRGKQVDSTRIGRLATATAQADIELARSAEEKKKLTFAIRVRSEDVGLIDAGMRMSVRFTHLPGFETATYVRIQQRTLAPTESDRGFYDMVITASNLGLPVVGGGTPGDFPFDPGGCTSTSSLFAGVTAGDYSTGSNGYWDSSTPVPSGQFFIDPQNVRAGVAGDSAVGSFIGGGPATYRTWIECDVGSARAMTEMVATYGTAGDATVHIWGNSSPMPATNPTRVYGGAPYPDPTTEGWTEIAGTWDPTGVATGVGPRTFTPTTVPTTAFRYWIIERQDTTTSNPEFVAEFTIDDWSGTACDSDAAPTPGQRFGPVTPVETPDGATYTFTLPAGYEFADSTIEVFVNRLDQTAAVTSYDGAARTFTLAFAPWGTDVIEVYGQGR